MKTTIKIGIVGLSIVLLTGCKEKSLQTEMPAPSISVATPVVQDITLTYSQPGSTRKRIPAILTTCAGCKS